MTPPGAELCEYVLSRLRNARTCAPVAASVAPTLTHQVVSSWLPDVWGEDGMSYLWP